MRSTLRQLGVLVLGLLLFAAADAAVAADPDPNVELAARASMSVDEALVQLRRNEPEARVAAAEALALHAERGDAPAIEALIRLLGDTHSKVRYHAEWGLARAGAGAVPALLAAFSRESDDERRAQLIHAIGRMGPAARAAEAELIEALEDPHRGTVGRAAYALAAMRSRAALPALVEAYGAARWIPTQREIARAIDVIGSHQSARLAREALIASMLDDLRSSDPERRAAAHRYAREHLRLVARDAPGYLPTRAELAVWVPPLEAALADPDADTLTIVRALGHAGGDASAAVPALRALLADPAIASEAERALAAIATPAANEILAQRAQLAALDKRIRREYQVLDHQGRTRLLPFYVVGRGADGVRMELRFLYPGEEPKRPGYVVIAFESYSAEPRFEGLAKMTWFADAEEIVIADIGRRQSSSQNGVIERVSGIVSIEAFERLVAARRVEAQLAALRFEISPDDRAALRHFAARIPPLLEVEQSGSASGS